MRICLFSLGPILDAASYGEILHTHSYRPCAGHVLGLMSIGSLLRK